MYVVFVAEEIDGNIVSFYHVLKEKREMKNSIVWFEVMGQNTDKLLPFYQEMFDWELEKAPDMNYHMLGDVEKGIPGGVGQVPQGTGWTTFYVNVESLDNSIASAERMGGKVLMPSTPLPDGANIAVISDPEGHPVGLFQAAANA